MIKPVSMKQFLVLGLCFWGYAVAQDFFVGAVIVRDYKIEAQRYENQAYEIEGRYGCSESQNERRRRLGLPTPKPGMSDVPLLLPSDNGKCNEASSLRLQAAGPKGQAHDAENVIKVFGFGGGLGGLVMMGMAAMKGWRNRKQAASAVA